MTQIFNSTFGPLEYCDTGSGEVILAIHGAMGGWDQSEILAKTVAPDGYRVIAVSRPGYLGTPLKCGVAAENQADLYCELLDYLNVLRCTVIAVSGGGYSAIYFAQRHAALCGALILCSAPGVANDSKIPFSFTVFTMLARFKPLMKSMKKRSEENFSETLKKAVSSESVRDKFLADTEAVDLYKGVALGMFDNIDQRLKGTGNDIRQTRKLTYPLREITVPTLIIHGTEDSVVPFEKHAQYLVANIPNAELYAVDGGEHSAIFTHRKAVRERVAQFLSEL